MEKIEITLFILKFQPQLFYKLSSNSTIISKLNMRGWILFLFSHYLLIFSGEIETASFKLKKLVQLDIKT